MFFATTYQLCHGSEAFRLWSLWLGHRLAEDGPADLENHLAQFAAMAIALGADPGSAAVLADVDRCAVVRARAFFRVAMALDELEPVVPSDDAIAA